VLHALRETPPTSTARTCRGDGAAASDRQRRPRPNGGAKTGVCSAPKTSTTLAAAQGAGATAWSTQAVGNAIGRGPCSRGRARSRVSAQGDTHRFAEAFVPDGHRQVRRGRDEPPVQSLPDGRRRLGRCTASRGGRPESGHNPLISWSGREESPRPRGPFNPAARPNGATSSSGTRGDRMARRRDGSWRNRLPAGVAVGPPYAVDRRGGSFGKLALPGRPQRPAGHGREAVVEA